MQFEIPSQLAKIERFPTGAEWLRLLPGLVAQVAAEWNLELGRPFDGSFVSYVVPARRNSEGVVLKIQWPHEECLYEANALRVWDGNGAIRLLDHDPEKHALLLERCLPGTHLADEKSVDPVAVLTELLPRLWKPVGEPFKPLVLEAELWASTLVADWERAGKPCEKGLVEAAMDYLFELPKSQGEQVLIHQDLHGDNILSAQREPWLAIDPKPLRGERELALAPLIRSFGFGHSKAGVIGRLDRLTAELELDRERARGWAIAQALAWAFDSEFMEQQIENAQWLMSA